VHHPMYVHQQVPLRTQYGAAPYGYGYSYNHNLGALGPRASTPYIRPAALHIPPGGPRTIPDPQRRPLHTPAHPQTVKGAHRDAGVAQDRKISTNPHLLPTFPSPPPTTMERSSADPPVTPLETPSVQTSQHQLQPQAGTVDATISTDNGASSPHPLSAPVATPTPAPTPTLERVTTLDNGHMDQSGLTSYRDQVLDLSSTSATPVPPPLNPQDGRSA
jgi:hypothetical protein